MSQAQNHLLIVCDHLYICLRFDFCKDAKEKRPSENLGQVLFGERIESSPYKVGVHKKM